MQSYFVGDVKQRDNLEGMKNIVTSSSEYGKTIFKSAMGGNYEKHFNQRYNETGENCSD